jgi:hypothetical protein
MIQAFKQIHVAFSKYCQLFLQFLQFQEFFGELENQLQAHHFRLVYRLNTGMLPLARRMEESAGRVLNISLAPVNIALLKHNPEEFHDDLTNLMKEGRTPSSYADYRVLQTG